ncbi:MAG: DegV family protein [Oscillospiraceae bacterium]|nr:DegV family protein [Oscillospiraceae bacterium]
MAVRIIIDSASDISRSEAYTLGITHIPMKIIFDDVEYSDGVDLTHREFFEKLIESDTLPTTCQIPPAEFADEFEKAVSEGDEVVCITISSKLSGTYQSAVIAASDYPGSVYVIDSENACIGERLLVLLAVDLVNKGLTAAHIASILSEAKKKIRVLGLLQTLEYLKRGGRISSAAAFAAGVLSIKPVVAVENGEVVVVGKARGSKQGNNLLRELVLQCGGIDFDFPVCLGYSGLSDETLRKYAEDNRDLWSEHSDKLSYNSIGAAIGTHVGPGVVAVAFFEK